jgi:transcriptional regulator with XRE-family HTH domain
MKQKYIAKKLGISKSYLSMILSGQRNPNPKLAKKLSELSVNFEAENQILSHARLPVPTLPHNLQPHTCDILL